jgi:serine/threonine protein kinase
MDGSEFDFPDTKRFRILRRLGAGGMGVVYEAYDRERGHVVALKSLLNADPWGVYRFKKEFRSLADMTHRNLVLLYELVVEDNHWFFTMELVHGVNFLEYVTGRKDASNDPTSPPTLTMGGNGNGDENPYRTTSLQSTTSSDSTQLYRLRSGLLQLAAGLNALHQMGNLHRDIKPSNVLVTGEGRVVILDFGLITELSNKDLDQTLSLVGTPAYMSPEQAAQLKITEASDWYSVGVMLYEALTGRRPFAGQLLEVLNKKQKYEPPPPSELVRDTPPDLDNLCRDLLRRDPQSRPSGKEVLERLGMTGATPSPVEPAVVHDAPFVGRQIHLAALTEAFRTTQREQAVVVYIHGNSGMGKSMLVRHFLEPLQRCEDLVVLAGRCYESESVLYKALDGIVDSLSRYLMSLPEEKAAALIPRDVHALGRLFPVLLQVPAVTDTPYPRQEIPDELVLRRRAFSALRELFGRISDRASLVLCIDDLQWADADSFVLLEELLRPPDPPPLLLLACFRSEEIESKPFLQSLLKRTGTENCREISVDTLTTDEARDLARALLPPEIGKNQSVESIVNESGGSPFFVEQLSRYAATDEDASTAGITLAEMLTMRIARLPEGAQPMLSTLAVAAGPIESDVAYAAAGLDGDERPLIAALRAAHFLRSSGSAQHLELYHDRIRETLVTLLEPEKVRDIHRSLAKTLETRHRDDPEALFDHWLGSGEQQRAGKYAVLAAKKAASALAFDRAALFYRRALELPPAEVTDPTIDLKVGLANALANAGRSGEAGPAYLDAARQTELGKAMELRRRAAEQLLMGGHIAPGLDVIRSVLDGVGMKLAAGPRRALLSLLILRARLRIRGLQFTEVNAQEVDEDTLLRIDVCWAVAAGLGLVDNLRANVFEARHLLLALEAGEPYRIARAMAIEGTFSAARGGPARRHAERCIQSAAELAQKVGHPHAIGLASMAAGQAAYLFGEWRKAFEKCERAQEILRDQCTGVTWEITATQRFLLTSLMYLGEIGELSRRMHAILAAAEEQGNRYATTDLRTRLNFMWLADDDPETARQEVAEAMGEWSSHGRMHLQHYNSVLALTQADLYSGASAAAWNRMKEQWQPMVKSMLMRIQVLRIETLHLRARSALAAAVGGGDVAPLLQDAKQFADRIEKEQMFWSEPLVFLVRAGIAGVQGNDSEARALLSSAAKRFQAAEMGLFQAVTERRLGQLTGGDQGRQMVSAADKWMRDHHVKNPQLMTGLLAPSCSRD